VWLGWTRPHVPVESGYSPSELDEGLAPSFFEEFHGLNVLLATDNRGMLYFDARLAVFDAERVTAFLHRLAAQIGRPLDVVVCRWPAPHLTAIPAAPGGPITIRFAAG
jgi:hypothetical protein